MPLPMNIAEVRERLEAVRTKVHEAYIELGIPICRTSEGTYWRKEAHVAEAQLGSAIRHLTNALTDLDGVDPHDHPEPGEHPAVTAVEDAIDQEDHR